MSHLIGSNGNSQHTSPKRSKKIIVVLSALVLGGVGLAACTDAEDSPRVVGTYTAAPVTTRAAATTTTTKPAVSLEGLIANSPGTPARKIDPYTSNGTWTVPGDIKPGDYRVIPTGITGAGGWKMCRTIRCEIGTNGFIDNDFVTGPSFVSIDTEAKYIELTYVRLEAVR